jgi:hypothetical protein
MSHLSTEILSMCRGDVRDMDKAEKHAADAALDAATAWKGANRSRVRMKSTFSFEVG